MGKCNVKIRFKDGTDVTIVDVFFVPYIFWNLLSIGQLKKKGILIISLMKFTTLVIKIRRLKKC